MNRIILIGNGFDLAHDLKTSYNDFIENIFEELVQLLKRQKTDCEILKKLITYNKRYSSFYEPTGPIPINNNNEYYIRYKKQNNGQEIKENNIFLSEFLKPKDNHNWGAIERIYYDCVINLLEEFKAYRNLDALKSNLKNLNNDFDIIIQLLEKYLTKITKNYKSHNNDILEKFKLGIDSKLIPIEKLIGEISISGTKGSTLERKYNKMYVKDRILSPNNTLIVNFNYTNIANNYLEKLENTELIYIHGKLNDPNNKIIFGYGNEFDNSYKELEDLEIDDALEYIKSVKYLETDNYKNVIEFVESEKYQVLIMGQSCSNTDKTLLNEIFEHKNCANIYNYYYKNYEKETDNWNSYSKNITRIFNNKQNLRTIVSPKILCKPLKEKTSI